MASEYPYGTIRTLLSTLSGSSWIARAYRAREGLSRMTRMKVYGFGFLGSAIWEFWVQAHMTVARV